MKELKVSGGNFMEKKIDIEDLYVGDVRYCMDRREAYPGEKTEFFVGDIFAHNVLLIKFEDFYVPFYSIEDQEDLNDLVLDLEDHDFASQKSRVLSEIPNEAGDEYIAAVTPFKANTSKQCLNFKEIRDANDEWELASGNEDYDCDFFGKEM